MRTSRRLAQKHRPVGGGGGGFDGPGAVVFDGRTIAAYTGIDKSFSGSMPTASGSNITEVADPTGLVRNVIEIALHENDKDTGSNTVRIQARKDAVHPNNVTQWIYHEHYLPVGFPNVGGVASSYLLLNEPHHPPYTGSPAFSLNVHDRSGVQKYDSMTSAGVFFWEVPRVLGKWVKVAFRVNWSTDAAVGWLEVYYAEKPNALVLQTHADGTTRRYMTTTPPDFTANGNFYINQYRRAGMTDFVGKLAKSYYAESRCWDAATTLAQLDPDV